MKLNNVRWLIFPSSSSCGHRRATDRPIGGHKPWAPLYGERAGPRSAYDAIQVMQSSVSIWTMTITPDRCRPRWPARIPPSVGRLMAVKSHSDAWLYDVTRRNRLCGDGDRDDVICKSWFWHTVMATPRGGTLWLELTKSQDEEQLYGWVLHHCIARGELLVLGLLATDLGHHVSIINQTFSYIRRTELA